VNLSQKLIKSPLRYPGGKSRGVNFLAHNIPPFQEFREVFFGGGSLSFYFLQKQAGATFHASDLNFELWCFWSQLQNASTALINGVQEIYDQYKSAELAGGKALFNVILNRRNNDLTHLQRAIDFYVLNRITFSGVVDSGGYSQASFEGRFTQSSIDRLKETAPVIHPIQFHCEDYSYLINRDGENVFLFLDPPYYAATASKLYGKNGILHTAFDHQLLFESLRSSPHKWLITYDNSEYIRNLYKDFSQLPWRLQYGMTNKSSAAGNELLIANYDLNIIGRL
jgi:DNA adenine methylase